MTGAAVALVVLAALDGMFSGFRSAAGRDGLIRTRRRDLLAQVRGLVLAVILLVPAALLGVAGLARGDRLSWQRAAETMVSWYLPFGVLVLLALVAYGTLRWEHRFLATAAILGPGTFLRPVVVLAGGVHAAVRADDWSVTGAAVLAVAGVLAVPSVCGRLWHQRLAPPAGDLAQSVI
ncbi:hypothetical protein [Nocardioides sp. BYT-33-1]|uniref:hypothetical protein n=1 Tax=Nocardioides sp. BYT-33-1 TaxID=3416952 RepID=UPI003F533C47